jgi:hypothetical protein
MALILIIVYYDVLNLNTKIWADQWKMKSFESDCWNRNDFATGSDVAKDKRTWLENAAVGIPWLNIHTCRQNNSHIVKEIFMNGDVIQEARQDALTIRMQRWIFRENRTQSVHEMSNHHPFKIHPGTLDVILGILLKVVIYLLNICRCTHCRIGMPCTLHSVLPVKKKLQF